MSQIKQICKKYNKDPKDGLVIKLRKSLGNNLGYFPVFAKWVFTNEISFEDAKQLIDLLKIVKIKKSINNFKTAEDLYDHITEIQNKQKLNQIIKSIPSNSRRNVSKRIKDSIYDNLDLYDQFKDFFSKKGGSCKSEDDLYQKVMEIVNNNKGEYSYKSILRDIIWKKLYTFGSAKYKIVYKDGKTIILKVNNYLASKLLGSSHWCISNKRSYWNSYLNHDRTQYFIYQTEFDRSDKRSMIGVTVNPIGSHIHASHYKDDSYCDRKEIEKYRKYLVGKNIELKSGREGLAQLKKHNCTDIEILFKVDMWDMVFQDTTQTYGFVQSLINSGKVDLTDKNMFNFVIGLFKNGFKSRKMYDLVLNLDDDIIIENLSDPKMIDDYVVTKLIAKLSISNRSYYDQLSVSSTSSSTSSIYGQRPSGLSGVGDIYPTEIPSFAFYYYDEETNDVKPYTFDKKEDHLLYQNNLKGAIGWLDSIRANTEFLIKWSDKPYINKVESLIDLHKRVNYII